MKRYLILILSGICFFIFGPGTSSAENFNHALYAEVLSVFLDNGRVDYDALKKNPDALDRYLDNIALLDKDVLVAMPRDEKIAFYINVYNAYTLKAVRDNYPVKSIKKIGGVWDRLKFKVAGEDLTLNDIEHEILRKEFKEPRIHFALVCASLSCPSLKDVLFEAENIDSQLNTESGRFINDKTKNKLDKKSNVLYLSSIFKWFRSDFGDVRRFVSSYLSDEERVYINDNNPKIKYLKYDWSLNKFNQ